MTDHWQKKDPSDHHLYDDLSWLWPIISPPEDYEDESALFAKLIQHTANAAPVTLLNLGCGGGSNDFYLKRSFDVTGVDLSSAMLKHAQELNPEARYLQGDMRDIRLNRTFDVVTILDAVAYMLTPDDLLAAFETAASHLKPGGVFLTFAEETPDTLQQNRTVYSRHVLRELDVLVIENTYDPDPTDTTFEVTFIYLVRRSGELSVHSDRHVCGVFPLRTWTELLGRAGFERPRVHYSEQLVSAEGRQLPLLVARKK